MRAANQRRLGVEQLEQRLCLASVGWDGPGRGGAELSYHIGSTGSLDREVVESTIEAALKVWSDVADITFTETSRSGQRDSLDFNFTRIDGRGGTLAQAYFPDDVNRSRVAGDVQFDTSESWEVGGRQSRAFDLMLVAVHEIGHALGLDHDHHHDSVLRASVSPREQFERLSASDVDAILELYAPAANPPATVTSTPSPALRPRSA